MEKGDFFSLEDEDGNDMFLTQQPKEVPARNIREGMDYNDKPFLGMHPMNFFFTECVSGVWATGCLFKCLRCR